MSSVLTRTQIVKLLEDYLRNYKSSMNVSTGTLVGDCIIGASADELEEVHQEITDIQEAQTISDTAVLTDAELEALAYNWNLTRKESVKAVGNVTFISLTQPTESIRIGSVDGSGGIFVQTGQSVDGTIASFTTTETVYLTTSTPYDSSVEGYSVTASIQSVEGGTGGNVSAGSIVSMRETVTGADRITNKIATFGGASEESNSDFASRIIYAVRGINVGTSDGMKSIAYGVGGVIDVEVVGPNDTGVVRGENGGSADIIVLGLGAGTYTEEINYNTDDVIFVFDRRPVTAISSITGIKDDVAKIAVSGTDYTFYRDITSTLARSTTADDYIQWLTSAVFDDGTNVTIAYQYTQEVFNVQEEIDLAANSFLTSSTIAKAAQEVLIDIAVTVTKTEGYLSSTVESDVKTSITTTINNLRLGESAEVSNIVYDIKQLDSIRGLAIPFDTLRERGTTDSPATITATKFEYLRVDDASITVTVEG